MMKRVALASFVGTTIEWYDFFLYGTAAALVFNKLFFPTLDPLAGTLASFGTYAVGFIARPLGGIVFGHYGDRVGRKSMLVVTLVIMGVATSLIGLLPTYETLGIWAAALLTLLRFVQGLAVGGEWGGAVLMAVEHAPESRRGFFGSWAQMGVPAGLLISTAVFSIFSARPQFLTSGWRVPFLLSVVLVAFGLFVRLTTPETPAFQRMKETRSESRLPIVDAVRAHPRQVLIAMGARLSQNAVFYIYTVWVLTYATKELGVARSTVLDGVLIAAALGLVAIPAYGALSDRVGRRPVYLAGAVFSTLFAFPFFWLLETKSTPLMWLALVLALPVGHDMMYGPQATFFAELFGTRVRYSGASLGYQLASVFAGGLSPFIATSLLAWAHGSPWAIAVYMMALGVVSIASVYVAAETYRGEIVEGRAAR